LFLTSPLNSFHVFLSLPFQVAMEAGVAEGDTDTETESDDNGDGDDDDSTDDDEVGNNPLPEPDDAWRQAGT
jgi:hypothetical protein